MAGNNPNKTVVTQASPAEFIRQITDTTRRKDAAALARMMREITAKRGRMWGSSMVGYGEYHYRYDSGREGDSFVTGFSPRKQNLTIYIMPGFDNYKSLLSKLGKHKLGKSCLYVKKLDDIHQDVLRQLIQQSVQTMKAKYKTNLSDRKPETN